jgi:hypothetical protein
MRVPIKDAELLAGFAQSPAYGAWKRLLAKRRTHLLEASLSVQEFSDVRYYRGGTDHMDWEQKTLRDIAKKATKDEDEEDA